jgi:hypothetical protein
MNNKQFFVPQCSVGGATQAKEGIVEEGIRGKVPPMIQSDQDHGEHCHHP